MHRGGERADSGVICVGVPRWKREVKVKIMYVFNNMVGSTGTGYSLKGKRLEFGMGGKWYKADSLGYEGAVEYAVSKILKHSNIKDYVSYQLEIINYNGDTFNGCVSIDFCN